MTILLTPGEPAGIGPDIIIQLAQHAWPQALIVIADPDLLLERAKKLNLPLALTGWDGQEKNAKSHSPAGSIKIFPHPLKNKSVCGILDTENARYVIETLSIAAQFCLDKKAAAVVTGPVHKSIINQAGIAFSGHTEFFRDYCGVSATVMLFVVDQCKIALATTHLPLQQVSAAITRQHLHAVLNVLHHDLQQRFHIAAPRIVVCGVNPHAGESGHLGREEIDVIAPLLHDLNQQGFHLAGPVSADTAFTPTQLKKADAILAMYHDQALPLVKYIGFGHAVNVTLGLPFIRTSVDHGTALDLAGTGQADAGSMLAALKLAIKLSA